MLNVYTLYKAQTFYSHFQRLQKQRFTGCKKKKFTIY